jgi:hypothetical protein
MSRIAHLFRCERLANVATLTAIAVMCSPPAAGVVQAQQAVRAGRVVVFVTAVDGRLPMPGVEVELRMADTAVVLAKTLSDEEGQVAFPDVPPGRYTVTAARPGFLPTESTPFDVQSDQLAQVRVNIQLAFAAPAVQVRAERLELERVSPVSTSDMLEGSVVDVAPLEGDDFQHLLPLLPGVVRGPDGRLRAKGGQPTQSALQISSTSLVDPSTGDFDLELPGQSLETVELLANPFSAEYGRFSTSVVQITTRRGTEQWEVVPGNLVPRFRGLFRGIRGFEPRLSVRGPLMVQRLFLAQDFQFRYVNDPVRSLPDEPEISVTSFDSFSRLDGVLSSRHSLGGLVVMFPRRVERLGMNTFRPPEVSPDFSQAGISFGLQDRFALTPTTVLESTVAVRTFEVEVNAEGDAPMVYLPEGVQGRFFNEQERDVRSVQWVETVSFSTGRGRGDHLFKAGLDLQHSSYHGRSSSGPVEARRLDGSLAELNMFVPETEQSVTANEIAAFVQDRWRVSSRVTVEAGLRVDKEDVVDRVSWSPRAGVAVAVLSEGRGILRGGVGRFSQRTPLNIGAFTSFEPRRVTRYAADGTLLGPPTLFTNVAVPDLRTPEAIAGNIEWNQRFGRRLVLKANYLRRSGSHEYVLTPDVSLGQLRLSNDGSSRYWEFELTGRYIDGPRRDLAVSYVRSRATADLNHYDQFFGNFRNPLVRANEYSVTGTDVPHRLLVRGLIGFPGGWDFAPVLELRSGFPWSAVDEFQDFVGTRNRAGRLPAVRTLDFSLSRPWRFKKYRFRAGVRVYNIFGSTAERDVQNNITSPNYGTFYNPLERSIGFVFGAAR